MSYRLVVLPEAEKEIKALRVSGDQGAIKKLNTIFQELRENPYVGTGKPKRLRYYHAVTFSRRISKKHRIIYSILEDIITVNIIQVIGHYDDK